MAEQLDTKSGTDGGAIVRISGGKLMKNGMRWILPRLLVCALLTGGSWACIAQNTNSGDLRGTATDTTGAVIQGVTVTVLDVDRGVTRTYVTDDAGLHDTGAIPESHYRLTFTKDGFATYIRGPVTLTLAIETVNAAMKVGAVSTAGSRLQKRHEKFSTGNLS